MIYLYLNINVLLWNIIRYKIMVKKLVCFDMDGVIFKDINFWLELHKKFGTFEQGKILTEKYLHTDYDRLVEEVVVKLWKGLDVTPYFELVNSLEYLEGVQETVNYFKNNGYMTAIISASSLDVARRAQKDLGFDYIFANELVIEDNKVSGEFNWPIGAGKENKAKIIQKLCLEHEIKLQDCVFIGDGETDIAGFQEVGTSIAFNPTFENPLQYADFVIRSDNLNSILECFNRKV